MPSFDIVSKTDMTSVDNALQGVTKEMRVRYDFKGSKSEVSKNDDVITILADDELKKRYNADVIKQFSKVFVHPSKISKDTGLSAKSKIVKKAS